MTSKKEPVGVARRPGRPRDPDRDRAILDAVIALLRETGIEQVGMREVAERSHTSLATIYRRWPSREELLLDAIQQFIEGDAPLPDTGELRGDLLAVLNLMLSRRKAFIESLPRLNAEAMSSSEIRNALRMRLTDLAGDRLYELLLRARSNGLIPADVDLHLIADTALALFVHKTMVNGRPPSRAYITRIVDQALLPMLGIGSIERPAERLRKDR